MCSVVVHCWADFESVHEFRCYDNIAPNAKWQRVLVLALWLIYSAPIQVDRGRIKVQMLLFSDTLCDSMNENVLSLRLNAAVDRHRFKVLCL